jgi:hypothetical protein
MGLFVSQKRRDSVRGIRHCPFGELMETAIAGKHHSIKQMNGLNAFRPWEKN